MPADPFNLPGLTIPQTTMEQIVPALAESWTAIAPDYAKISAELNAAMTQGANAIIDQHTAQAFERFNARLAEQTKDFARLAALPAMENMAAVIAPSITSWTKNLETFMPLNGDEFAELVTAWDSLGEWVQQAAATPDGQETPAPTVEQSNAATVTATEVIRIIALSFANAAAWRIAPDEARQMIGYLLVMLGLALTAVALEQKQK